MGKKDKTKEDKAKKLEKKLQNIENKLEKGRQKMLEVLAKMGKRDVEDYVLKDWNNTGVKLSDMFGDKQDLIVIHNMGKSCAYCTMWADGFNGIFPHIEQRAAFALVSPDAPEIQKEFADNRGWKFKMYSGKDSTFIKDMGYLTDKGDYWPGASAFHKDEDGAITRVSKTFFGPGDFFCSVWHFFDMLPLEKKNKQTS